MDTINLFLGIWNQTPSKTRSVVKTTLVIALIILGLAIVGSMQHDGAMPLHTR